MPAAGSSAAPSSRPPERSSACAAVSESLGEEMFGTAPATRRWLLLEQPGPWGEDAVTQSDLPGPVSVELERLSAEHDFRVQLIRRTPRRYTPERLTCFAASSSPGATWMQRLELPDAHGVLELDFPALAAGEPLAVGERWSEPVYAVCTHGRNDACCARRGRPLVRALRAHRPQATWECSHISGHRFAATLIAFPQALFYGRVPAAEAAGLAERHERGELALELLRGRAGDAWEVQAAEHFARRRLGLRRMTDIAAVSHRPAQDPGRVELEMRTGETATVRVARAATGHLRSNRCGGPEEYDPGRIELVSWAMGSARRRLDRF